MTGNQTQEDEQKLKNSVKEKVSSFDRARRASERKRFYSDVADSAVLYFGTLTGAIVVYFGILFTLVLGHYITLPLVAYIPMIVGVAGVFLIVGSVWVSKHAMAQEFQR